MTIWVPEDFRGAAEIVWWYPDKLRDEDKQQMRCSCVWLLHDVRGSRPLGSGTAASFDARVGALVVHEFYRQRIFRAAQLEAAYQWQVI